MSNAQPKLRITKRGRRVLVAAGFAVLAPLLGFGAKAVASEPTRPEQVSVYTVAPGDSLWRLARSVASDNEDLRDVVRDLQRLNELSDSTLEVGQVILLPVR